MFSIPLLNTSFRLFSPPKRSLPAISGGEQAKAVCNRKYTRAAQTVKKPFTLGSLLRAYSARMKATDVIKRDHEAIEAYFKEFEAASTDERVDMEPKLFNMLTAHELMEDRHLYSALSDRLEDDSILKELKDEQSKLEVEASAIRMMVGVRDEKLLEAFPKILAHAKKEQDELFPLAEKVFTPQELEDIGNAMAPRSAVEAADDSIVDTVKNMAS